MLCIISPDWTVMPLGIFMDIQVLISPLRCVVCNISGDGVDRRVNEWGGPWERLTWQPNPD